MYSQCFLGVYDSWSGHVVCDSKELKEYHHYCYRRQYVADNDVINNPVTPFPVTVTICPFRIHLLVCQHSQCWICQHHSTCFTWLFPRTHQPAFTDLNDSDTNWLHLHWLIHTQCAQIVLYTLKYACGATQTPKDSQHHFGTVIINICIKSAIVVPTRPHRHEFLSLDHQHVRTPNTALYYVSVKSLWFSGNSLYITSLVDLQVKFCNQSWLSLPQCIFFNTLLRPGMILHESVSLHKKAVHPPRTQYGHHQVCITNMFSLRWKQTGHIPCLHDLTNYLLSIQSNIKATPWLGLNTWVVVLSFVNSVTDQSHTLFKPVGSR